MNEEVIFYFFFRLAPHFRDDAMLSVPLEMNDMMLGYDEWERDSPVSAPSPRPYYK